MFRSEESLGAKPWSQIAADVGVQDTRGFEACMSSDRTAAVLERDLLAAQRLGVRGTPTILIDFADYWGVPSGLAKIINRHLDH
ncbi:MAG: DsbA family protein [Gemmatimonadota bacterium]|nr:MAG: DsbA family protein [Gemmatimonadota bacterium]